MGRAARRLTVPHNRPALSAAEARAAARCLASGWVAQGPEAAAFERAMHARLGLPGRGVAASSGSAALHLALLAMGARRGDAVLIPTYVCGAVLNAVRYALCRPVLCDISAGSLAMDPADAARRRTRATRFAVVPHPFGTPAPVEAFRRMGLSVVEDCAQAGAARRDGKPAGTLGDCAIWSFGATKPITSGGAGGMLVSRSAALLSRARDLRDYDRRRDAKLRFNYQMTDLAAAVGRVQLKRLDAFARRRAAIARRYRAALSGLPGVSFQEASPADVPFFYRFVIRVPDATRAIRRLARAGVEAIRPIAPWQLLHRQLGLSRKDFPVAERAARDLISLPIYPALTDAQVRRVIAAAKRALS